MFISKKTNSNQGHYSKDLTKFGKKHMNRGQFKRGCEGSVRVRVPEEWKEPVIVKRLTENVFRRVPKVSQGGSVSTIIRLTGHGPV